ncbi:B-cell receptor CD22 [Xenopus laevis]|uniref:B-cell receptor CD22 n=1 Tax=Xenopus laevis TaxID=8355 RepID=A0A8J1LAJ3_XENLA|nr:B-cell receptor CD22 [Xenopus laevis]
MTNTIVRILLLTLLPETLGQQWSFSFPQSIQALKGSCVEIPCSYTRPASQQPPNVIWYLYNRKVLADYRSRAKILSNSPNSCTLHISNVRSEDYGSYYPGVDDKNAYKLFDRLVRISITDAPNIPNLLGPREMAEGTPVIIKCSVEHTCGSNPPILQWNKRGPPVKTEQKHLSEGRWEAISEMTYSPTYEDDETEIQCSAAYPNGQSSQQAATLKIIYPPKNITVLMRQQVIQEEDDVTLSCFSNSKLEIYSYEWFKGMEKIKLPVRDQEITVRNVSWVTEPYSCSAWNSQGKGESALTLIPVQYAPKEVQIVKNERPDGGIELNCSFSSSRPNITHFTWLKNDVPITTQTKPFITLENAEENSGEYQCIVHNKVGNSSSDNQVTIQFNGTMAIDLSMVLGGAAGVIALIFIVIIIYCCISTRKKKSPQPDTIGTIPSMAEAPPTKMDDHLYDTLTDGKYHLTSDSDSTSPLHASSRKSKFLRKEDEDCHYYSADDKGQEEPEDIEYAAIRFSQNDQPNEASQQDGHTEHTVYAILNN